MSHPLSVRLDSRTSKAIDRLARRRGLKRSQVVRDALDLLLEREGQSASVERPCEMVAHLIGCVRGGPPDLSERTGEKFRGIVQSRRSGRS